MHTPSAVCVYCGSSSQVDERHKRTAHAIGTALAMAGIDVVYGGGRVGLMGIVADSALAVGGRVIGIIPEHIQKWEVEHTGLSELHVVPDMHTRKRMMVDRSDGFVTLPGGLGTLDETFEILTWKQLRLHDKPVVILNSDGYWTPFLGLIEHMIAEGFYKVGDSPLFTAVDDVEAVIPALQSTGDTNKAVETQWL